MTDFVMILVSVEGHDEGERISRALVEARLAACVQIFPIESIYRWEGAIQKAKECLLIAKARGSDFAEIASAVRKLHSYDVSEIVALPVLAGSETYLTWLSVSTER